VDEQIVVGTAVQVELSGEVWKVTVELRVPVVLRVTRQFTQGVAPLRFETVVPVALPVKL
jgi:hypothetical protein